MNPKEPWFVSMRAEALASLYLSHRDDLEIVRAPLHAGYHFLAYVSGDPLTGQKVLAIEARGRRSAGAASKRANEHVFSVDFAAREGQDARLPWCVFLFDVDTEEGCYRWLYEPLITPQGQADLRLNAQQMDDGHRRRGRLVMKGPFKPLDAAAIDTIVAQVEKWYAVKYQGLVQPRT